MKFNIYTLGCKVNTYESNVMADKMKNAGFIEVGLKDSADISIINTCTVTNTADSKSMKMIRHARKINPNAIIVVCGCMSQNKQEEIEEADIVLGNVGKSCIVDYINDYIEKSEYIYDVNSMDDVPFEEMTLNNFNKTRAFVKIQDGCNNFCSYCIIPYSRGDVRSKRRIDVLREVCALVQNGHKEIVLTGIHTGNYGAEFDNYDFASLLEELVEIEGLERLRISSIEITEINERVIKLIKNNKVLVSHMHIPLQSGSDSILERMNRKYDMAYFKDKIKKIRSIRPDISITTDVIVGFPGETEEEFMEMVDNIRDINFSKLHVFPYSKREGTVAADMEGQIDEALKKKRAHILLELSKELEMDYMGQFLNKEVEFIPEVYKDGYLIGHTGNYLSIKCKGIESELYLPKKVVIKELSYPYCVGE